MSDEQPTRPLLRVVRGEPTPEQLAALLAVVSAAGQAESSAEVPAASPCGWTDRAAAFRGSVRVDAGAWRASGWRPGVRTRAGW